MGKVHSSKTPWVHKDSQCMGRVHLSTSWVSKTTGCTWRVCSSIPWVNTDPHRTGRVRSPTKHHGSIKTHDMWGGFVHLQNNGFIWVQQHMGRVRSFIKHHGSIKTHDMRGGFIHLQNTIDLYGPITYGEGSFIHKTPWVHKDPQRTSHKILGHIQEGCNQCHGWFNHINAQNSMVSIIIPSLNQISS